MRFNLKNYSAAPLKYSRKSQSFAVYAAYSEIRFSINLSAILKVGSGDRIAFEQVDDKWFLILHDPEGFVLRGRNSDDRTVYVRNKQMAEALLNTGFDEKLSRISYYVDVNPVSKGKELKYEIFQKSKGFSIKKNESI